MKLNDAPGLDRKDLLGLEELSEREIRLILDTAREFREVLDRPIKTVPAMRGFTIANLFYESSTRTRMSFELAQKRLTADSIGLAVTASSVKKGESLRDTARNIEAMRVDMIVMRHSQSGAPHRLAAQIDAHVVNAGDGCHEHPTQGLLDLYTLLENLGDLRGKRIVIIGDIAHSRVARSNIHGLRRMGAQVGVCGPPTLIPVGIEDLGVTVYPTIEEALAEADAINVLRIQLERIGVPLFPSTREYARLFGVTPARLEVAKREVLVLHPGPINRNVELDSRVADAPGAVILSQVTNGVAIRMAVTYLLAQKTMKAAHALA
ncbi:MAG: aspartate carbamoyltransferase [Gemmatimonadetes bacterium]|nr:aspartate carbamoyltransferase [Gemmatimonadota bacterium]